MIIAVLTLISLAIWVCRRRGHLRTSRALAATTLAVLYLTACGPLAHVLLKVVQPTDGKTSTESIDWSKSPAIVVIGAGVTRAPNEHRTTLPVWSAGRVMRAAQIYSDCSRQNSNCMIFLSGGKTGLDQVTEADLFAEHLQTLGVPKDHLVLERLSDNTWQNVEFTAPLLREYRRDGRPIVLTSGIHVWRTERYFREFGIDIVPIATDYLDAEISFIPTALNLALADLALHEIAGMARLHVYSALGLNR